MAALFDGVGDIEDIAEIYEKMEANCPNPWSNSKALWELRCACDIEAHNPSLEILLEKAVAMLAKNGHMDEWSNQCPTASGINDSSRNRGNRVDLVYWSQSKKQARLVELKWGSNDPPYALKEILRYGAAYIFCRFHENELPLRGRSLMKASHVSLEVVAPHDFYCGDDERKRIERMRKSIDKFVGSKINGLSMSLDALAFPEGFAHPFTDGADVKKKCDTGRRTDEGLRVRDAFNNLAPVWP